MTEVTTVTPEVVEALAALIPQLSSSAPAPTRAEIDDIAASPATILLLARDGHGAIVGSLTLVLFRAPTGPRAWIEDVVVDTSTRGQGIGAALVRACPRPGRIGRGPDRRPHLTPVAGSRQPPLRPARLRATGHQRLPVESPTRRSLNAASFRG